MMCGVGGKEAGVTETTVSGLDSCPARTLLGRLDAIGAHLSSRGDALAVMGLGSVGVDRHRLDEHSDVDFFVVVEDEAKQRYLDSIDWLEAVHGVAYSFVNVPN